ncbi:MAG TPA: ABC transporter permease [Burkholderiales bacterium]|nr:ABC transporter permease [Burkholderiales bacterium]
MIADFKSLTVALSWQRMAQNAPLIAFMCSLVLLFIGSLINANFISPTYLLQQLQVGSFLGIVAAGMMLVILLGHIDLSVPWTMTTGAMMATAVAGTWGPTWAIPVGVGCGIAIGVVNGLGVAYLRIPSMIFTLGVNAMLQGLMVLHTGGFAPQDKATPLMQTLAVERTLGIPNGLWVWFSISIVIFLLMTRTTFGRYVYAMGNRESAAYLSGAPTHAVLIGCFTLCGALAAFAGVMIAGYSSNAYQAMGDQYLLPAIAAVVLGGTNILGGRGSYVGTVAGVILIVLLQSMLAVLQMPEAGRQIIYGIVILAMLLLYGRGAQNYG